MLSNRMDQKSFLLLVLFTLAQVTMDICNVSCSNRPYRTYKWTNDWTNENSIESCWTFKILNQHDKRSMTKCDLKSTKNGLKEKSIKSVQFESIVSKRYIDFVCGTNNRICTLPLARYIAFALATLEHETKHTIF